MRSSSRVPQVQWWMSGWVEDEGACTHSMPTCFLISSNELGYEEITRVWVKRCSVSHRSCLNYCRPHQFMKTPEETFMHFYFAETAEMKSITQSV